MLSFDNFFNPHYWYIQEHLRPSSSICICPCFFMIYQSRKKKKLPWLHPHLIVLGFEIIFQHSSFFCEQSALKVCKHIFQSPCIMFMLKLVQGMNCSVFGRFVSLRGGVIHALSLSLTWHLLCISISLTSGDSRISWTLASSRSRETAMTAHPHVQ